MIKEIVKDREFLSKPAEEGHGGRHAGHRGPARHARLARGCRVCLAANQIGSIKAVIAYRDGDRIAVMLNPQDQARRAAV